MKVIPNMRSLTAVAIAAFAGHVFGIGAPTGLSVAPVDYTQATCNIDCSARLSWTAPADGAATGYKIYRRIAAAERRRSSERSMVRRRVLPIPAQRSGNSTFTR